MCWEMHPRYRALNPFPCLLVISSRWPLHCGGDVASRQQRSEASVFTCPQPGSIPSVWASREAHTHQHNLQHCLTPDLSLSVDTARDRPAGSVRTEVCWWSKQDNCRIIYFVFLLSCPHTLTSFNLHFGTSKKKKKTLSGHLFIHVSAKIWW